MEEIRQTDLALRYLSEAAELEPDDPGVHYNLGTLYLRLGQWEKAEGELQRAAQLKPDLPGMIGLLHRSRREMKARAKRISTQNIVFSLLLLAVLIPSALLGVMTVAASVFFHETSELLAVANGLRVAKT